MPRSSAERGISEEQYAGWRTEFGHQMEEKFSTACEKFGIKTFEKDPPADTLKELAGKKETAIVRASGREDFEEGIDFKILSPLTGELIPMDISVSSDPKVHAQKRQKERETGVRFLPLSARTLKLAAQGARRDQEELFNQMRLVIYSDALNNPEKAKLSPEQADRLKEELGKAGYSW